MATHPESPKTILFENIGEADYLIDEWFDNKKDHETFKECALRNIKQKGYIRKSELVELVEEEEEMFSNRETYSNFKYDNELVYTDDNKIYLLEQQFSLKNIKKRFQEISIVNPKHIKRVRI